MLPVNHPQAWKVGLATALLGAAGWGLLLAWGSLRGGETLAIVTYLDEPVDSLPLDAPVQIRGVIVGRVTGIGLAGDQRHVEVEAELGLLALERLGLRRPGERVRRGVPPFTELPGLRAYLAPVGITSTSVLQLDVLDPARYPPPRLPFETPWNYVPATASTARTIVLSVDKVVPRIPGVLDGAEAFVAAVESALATIDARALRGALDERLSAGERLVEAVDPAAVARIDSTLAGWTVQLAEMTEAARRLQATLDDPQAEPAWLEAVVAELEGKLREVDLPAITGQVRSLSEGAQSALRSVGETIAALRAGARALGELSRELRRLTGPLDRDPGGLFYGEHRAPPPGR